MKKTRKRYSAQVKARVALEAIRSELALAELAAKHGVHHTMIAAWKRQARSRGWRRRSQVLAMRRKPPAMRRWRSCTPRSA